MNESSFTDKSYESHRTHFKDHVPGGDKFEHALTWLRKDNIDYWRHERMYKSLLPFLEISKGGTWLTVGDGRLGSDARYLIDHGARAHASDIGDSLLKVAAERGVIQEYSAQNSESLKFSDRQFQYGLCKESFHHFPRPWIAVHELLRVVTDAVILIEPQDHYVDTTFLQRAFLGFTEWLKKKLGKDLLLHQFEDVGNYVYTLSKREVDKAALGIGLRYVAYFELNDFFTEGVEKNPADSANPLFKKVQFRLKLSDFFTKMGLRKGLLLVAVIFKTPPSAELRKQMLAQGYEIRELPANPYL